LAKHKPLISRKVALVQEVQRMEDLQVLQFAGHGALTLVLLSKKPNMAIQRDVEKSIILKSPALQVIHSPLWVQV